MSMPLGHTAGYWDLPLRGRVFVVKSSLPLMCSWGPQNQVENSGWIPGWTWGEIYSFSSSAMTWCLIFHQHRLLIKNTNTYWALTLCRTLVQCFTHVDWINSHHGVMWWMLLFFPFHKRGNWGATRWWLAQSTTQTGPRTYAFSCFIASNAHNRNKRH